MYSTYIENIDPWSHDVACFNLQNMVEHVERDSRQGTQTTPETNRIIMKICV
jgi:hypothetical protein